MKKFYLCTGDFPKGPFRIDELIKQGVSATDPIWCEEFGGDSKPAVDITELKSLFIPAVRNKPVTKSLNLVTKPLNMIMEKWNAISIEPNDKSKYISLFKWSCFAIIVLIVYYCIVEFSN